MAVKEWSAADQALLDKMPQPNDDEKLFLRAVIYGDAGTGKTVMSCSLGKTLILAADPGWVSVKNHPDIDKNVTPVAFGGYKQLETLARAFYHQVPPYDEYDTFVIDTLAFIQETYVDILVRGGKFNKDTRPTYEVTDPNLAKDLVLKEIPGRDDYHAAKNVLRGPIRTLNQAPVNVIYIAHEREPSENETKKGIRITRPDVTEALYKVVFRDAHLVGRCVKDNGIRGVDFNQTPLQAAKSRIASLNDKRIRCEKFPEAIKKWQNADWDVPSFAIIE